MATDKTACHNDKYFAIFPLHFLFNYFLYLLTYFFFQPYYGYRPPFDSVFVQTPRK